MLKGFDCKLLRGSDTESTSMPKNCNKRKKYNGIQRAVLHPQNLFLKTVEKEYGGYRLHVACKKGVSGGTLKRLPSETKITGMLEATEFDALHSCHQFWVLLSVKLLGKKPTHR